MSLRISLLTAILLPVLGFSGIMNVSSPRNTHRSTETSNEHSRLPVLRGAAWVTGGNDRIAPNHFIGTLNRQDFRIHVAGREHAVFTVDGRVGINANPPAKQLDVRFADRSNYHPLKWSMDGMFLYNNWKTTSTGHGSALTFGAIGGAGAHMARAIISGQVVDSDRMDIVFQNEFDPPDLMRESMRITSDGCVGIGTGATRPIRPLHTVGTIRFSALEYGRGDYLVVDDNGDVHRSSLAPASGRGRVRERPNGNDEIELLERRIKMLEADVIALRKELGSRGR